MPYEASLLNHLEDALSGCYHYHDQLNNFLIRSQIPIDILTNAKLTAESRRSINNKYSKAPKRWIVQALINDLQCRGENGDFLLASLFTSISKGIFPDADAQSEAAIKYIKRTLETDKEEKKQKKENFERELNQKEHDELHKRNIIFATNQKERDTLRDEFIALMQHPNSQERGYLFEKFLNKLFKIEGLDPRASFRVIGEQIDGSFSLGNQTHLVEAKWTSKKIAGAEFGAFMYKIGGKSVETRGLYIAINGYSEEAVKGLNGKGNLNFVCVDGSHIMRSLEIGQSLRNLLSEVWRHASETGNAYLPISQITCR